jgi:dihydrofolate synthase / folylpolyglutamate synthase
VTPFQKIATEKAGIIKSNVPIIISERQAEVSDVFIRKAEECNSRLLFAADSYKVKKLQDGVYEVQKRNETNRYELDLLGVYQVKNIMGVLAVVDELRRQGYNITNEQLAFGLRNATGLTGLKGRWQRLNDNPLTICDTGHNEAGIKEILTQISEIKFAKLHWVLGMVKDKDVSSILQLLPKDAAYYFCQASIPRAMPAIELKERAQAAGLNGIMIQDVNEAIAQARANSSPDDLIMIGGSTFVVAEIENL